MFGVRLVWVWCVFGVGVTLFGACGRLICQWFDIGYILYTPHYTSCTMCTMYNVRNVENELPSICIQHQADLFCMICLLFFSLLLSCTTVALSFARCHFLCRFPPRKFKLQLLWSLIGMFPAGSDFKLMNPSRFNTVIVWHSEPIVGIE